MKESALHRIRRLGGENILLPPDIGILNAGVARALALISDGKPHTGPEITKATGMDSGRRRMREVREAVKPLGFRLPCWRANRDSMVFLYQLMPALTGEEIAMKIQELADAVLTLTQASEKIHQSLTAFQAAVIKAESIATELKNKAGDVEVPGVPAGGPAQQAAAQQAAAQQAAAQQAAAQQAAAQQAAAQQAAMAGPGSDARQQAGTTPSASTAPGPGDQFIAFADQLKTVIAAVPPGSLNAQLAEMINRYAPGSAAPGQGGIRNIPPAQYANFLAEVGNLVASMSSVGGQA